MISKKGVKTDFVAISSWGKHVLLLSLCSIVLAWKFFNTVTCHTSGWARDRYEGVCDSVAIPYMVFSPMLLLPTALSKPGGKPGRAPSAHRAPPPLTETVNHPSPWLMVGCGVTDNLSSCQSCIVLQIPYGLCKAHMCSEPFPPPENKLGGMRRTYWDSVPDLCCSMFTYNVHTPWHKRHSSEKARERAS